MMPRVTHPNHRYPASMSAFQPDSFIVSDVVPSSNVNERVGGPPDLLLLHYTGMQTGEAAPARLTSAESKVSAGTSPRT